MSAAFLAGLFGAFKVSSALSPKSDYCPVNRLASKGGFVAETSLLANRGREAQVVARGRFLCGRKVPAVFYSEGWDYASLHGEKPLLLVVAQDNPEVPNYLNGRQGFKRRSSFDATGVDNDITVPSGAGSVPHGRGSHSEDEDIVMGDYVAYGPPKGFRSARDPFYGGTSSNNGRRAAPYTRRNGASAGRDMEGVGSTEEDEISEKIRVAKMRKRMQRRKQEKRTQEANSLGGQAKSFVRSLGFDPAEDEEEENMLREEMLRARRESRERQQRAFQFFFTVTAVPVMCQAVMKNAVIGPLVDLRGENTPVFLNETLEEKAFAELQRYEERLHFEMLIGKVPHLDKHEMEEKLKHKADELGKTYRSESLEATKNMFAAPFFFAAFALVVFWRKRDIPVVKQYLDGVFRNLSDSTKAFLIILFTDVLCGFHSSHGWEVLMENVFRHLGLPENREAVFSFIAIVPVFMDVMIKYWIFTYINRISPSSVATFRAMNE